MLLFILSHKCTQFAQNSFGFARFPPTYSEDIPILYYIIIEAVTMDDLSVLNSFSEGLALDEFIT